MLQRSKKGPLSGVFITLALAAVNCFCHLSSTTRGSFFFYGDFNVQRIPFYKLAHEGHPIQGHRLELVHRFGANFIGSL